MRRVIRPTAEQWALAFQIADQLFAVGSGREPERLGGWGREPIAGMIAFRLAEAGVTMARPPAPPPPKAPTR